MHAAHPRELALALISVVAASATVAASAPEAVTFSRRTPSVGDQAEQTIAVEFRLKTTTRDGAQVLEEADTSFQRNQRRRVTTAALGPHGPSAATVEYQQAERSISGGQPMPEPIVGKAYRCVRDGEQLRVTGADGSLPTMQEFEIVSKNMETLGRENPLTNYFDGRRVAVGERIDLPLELAGALLGFEDKLAAAKRFSMTLVEVRDLDGRLCGVFKTTIEAGSGGGGQMGLIVDGTLVMQAEGCRAVSARLSGPIGMSETRSAGPGQRLLVSGVGKLRVAINTRYRDAR